MVTTDKGSVMSGGTDTTKRYVFVCAACDLLAESGRSDTITCSPRCRAWLHRNRHHLDGLQAQCDAMKITLQLVLQAKAVYRLRPDLSAKVIAGNLELKDTRGDVSRTFNRMLMEHLIPGLDP